MSRVFKLVLVSSLWLLPASSAFAGTWSWHSDFVQQLVEVIQSQQIRSNHTRDAAARPAHTRDTKARTSPRASR